MILGLPWYLSWWRIFLQCRRPRLNSWVRKIPWRRVRLPTPVFWPGEFHGQRSLAGYSPWSCKETDRIEWLMLLQMILWPSLLDLRPHFENHQNIKNYRWFELKENNKVFELWISLQSGFKTIRFQSGSKQLPTPTAPNIMVCSILSFSY